MLWGKLNSQMQKNETGLFSHTIYKNKLKMVTDLNVRTETTKHLQEIIGSMFFDISPMDIVFTSVSSSKGKKSKNKQMGSYQMKKPLCNKENHQQNKKAAYCMG